MANQPTKTKNGGTATRRALRPFITLTLASGAALAVFARAGVGRQTAVPPPAQTPPPVAAPDVPTDKTGKPQTAQETAAPVNPTPSVRPASPLHDAYVALKEGRSADAARFLKAIKTTSLEPNDARRYRTYAAQAAVRTGDKAWLDELNNDPDKQSIATDLLLLTAMRFIQSSDYDEARALLSRVQNPQGLDEIPRRRYLQLWARLEQITGHPDRERVYVAKLVDFAGRWQSVTCQGCHADDKKFPNQVTTLDVANWWVGARFSDLLTPAQAKTVRAQAEKRLAQNGDDQGARLRLAYALRAQNQAARSEKELRALPWAEFPDREKRTPPRVATFP